MPVTDYYNSKQNQQETSDAYMEWTNRFVVGLYHGEPDTHRNWGDKINRLNEYVVSAHIKYYPEKKMKFGAIGTSRERAIIQTKNRYPFVVIEKAMILK